MNVNKELFLQIIRLGIGNARAAQIPENVDWNELETFAAEHGLSAIVVDGLEKLPDGQKPPKPVLLQWIGEVLQGYEYRYELYCRTIAEMAAFYNEHGYKMMVLKGYACSLDWPKPEHRPCGDIDIWQFGQQKEADKDLEASFKVQDPSFKIDRSHHHHTVFDWRDFMVENHYDFMNVHARKSSKALEKVFKELGKDDSYSINLYGEKVYLPSPNLHALFLIRHMVSHFVGSNITLRQVLDWAFFVKAQTKEIDWNWLVDLLDKYHMKDFYNCINAICIEDLGFPINIFPSVQFEPVLKEKVLSDILDPAFETKAPRIFVARVLYKYRRWQGNAWKQDLCYNESKWSAFWSGIWAKMLKPASI